MRPIHAAAVATVVAAGLVLYLFLDVAVAPDGARPDEGEDDEEQPEQPDDDVHAAFAVADAKVHSSLKAASALFRRVAAERGFALAQRASRGTQMQAYWDELAGTPARVFAVIGPVADLAVVSRPAAEGASRARAFLLGALLHSAKPVLVMPQVEQATLGKRIVVAWNQSADAAAAVTAALPLLTRAERVVAVTAGRENRLGPKSSHLARSLATWDVAVECKRTPGRQVEREILRTCRELDADLLVMGAYSSSRLRQLVLGSVTGHMLFKAELPVLLQHR